MAFPGKAFDLCFGHPFNIHWQPQCSQLPYPSAYHGPLTILGVCEKLSNCSPPQPSCIFWPSSTSHILGAGCNGHIYLPFQFSDLCSNQFALTCDFRTSTTGGGAQQTFSGIGLCKIWSSSHSLLALIFVGIFILCWHFPMLLGIGPTSPPPMHRQQILDGLGPF